VASDTDSPVGALVKAMEAAKASGVKSRVEIMTRAKKSE